MKFLHAPTTRMPLLMLGLLLVGCVTTKAPPGKIRFKEWWNFYERGTERLKTGQVAAAQKDFETCLGLRAGAKTTNKNGDWKVRTYGIHFIHDYFPYRELGVSLHLQGRSREALKFLEESLRRKPTGRAKYYYNEVQAALIAAAPVPARPTLNITTAQLTNQKNIQLSGRAIGNGLIRTLTIGGQALFVEQTRQLVTFAQVLPLQEGINLIEVVAEDLRGQAINTNVSVLADWTPPEVWVKPEPGSQEAEVRLRDASGIQQVSLNGAQLAATPQPEQELTLNVPLQEEVQLLVSDVAGNQRQLTLPAADPDPAHSLRIQLPDIPSRRPARSFREHFYLDMHLKAPAGIAGLRLDGKDLLPPAQRGQTWAYLSTILKLQPGANIFDLVLEDGGGTTSRRSVEVNYTEPVFMDEAYRLRCELTGNMAPKPLQRNVSSNLTARAYVRSHFLKPKQPRFQLLNTTVETLERIMTELELSDLASEQARLKLSRKLDSEMLFVLQIFEYRKGHTVRVEAFDAYTSEVMFDTDVYLPGGRPDTMRRQMEGLVSKIERRYPLLQGRILEVGRGSIKVDVGRENGAMEGHRFLVLRKCETVEASQLIRVGDEVLEMSITDVSRKSSRAVITPKQGRNLANPADIIIAR